MFEDYKVVSVTPAGRKYCMELLADHLLKLKNVIDEHHFWVNTIDFQSIEFMKKLQKDHPDFFKLKFHKNEKKSYHITDIHVFFNEYIEEKTIYVRFDDDIIWIDNEINFKKFLKFRVDNPQFFLIYANIINNGLCNHLHQRLGAYEGFNNLFIDKNSKLKKLSSHKSDWYGGDALGESYWNFNEFVSDSINENGLLGYNSLNLSYSDPLVAKKIHDIFLNKKRMNLLHEFYFTNWRLMEYERVSINCISWLGSEFKKFNGCVGVDEEKWLSVTKPKSIGKINCIYGGFLTVHFGFNHQHKFLIENNLISDYKLLSKNYKKTMADLYKIEMMPKFNLKNILKVQHLDEYAYFEPKKIKLKDFTFVIPIHIDSLVRKENFSTSLQALNNICDTNIIILEHGQTKQIFDLPKNCEYYFFSQNDTFFHRNKILNFGYKKCKTKFCVNFEADCILSPNGLSEAVEALRNNFKFAIPYGYLAYFLDKKTSLRYKQNKILPLFWKEVNNFDKFSEQSDWRNWEDQNKFDNGLCFMFDLETYRECGFENENMKKHGGDDYEHYIRVKKIGYEIYNSNGLCYHLWHPRDVKTNNWYSNNTETMNEFLRIESLSTEELKQEISTWPWTKDD